MGARLTMAYHSEYFPGGVGGQGYILRTDETTRRTERQLHTTLATEGNELSLEELLENLHEATEDLHDCMAWITDDDDHGLVISGWRSLTPTEFEEVVALREAQKDQHLRLARQRWENLTNQLRAIEQEYPSVLEAATVPASAS